MKKCFLLYFHCGLGIQIYTIQIYSRVAKCQLKHWWVIIAKNTEKIINEFYCKTKE